MKPVYHCDRCDFVHADAEVMFAHMFSHPDERRFRELAGSPASYRQSVSPVVQRFLEAAAAGEGLGRPRSH